MELSAKKLADIIIDKITININELRAQYQKSDSIIQHFYLDDLLPTEIANQIRNSFPSEESMVLKKSLREYKYIAAQMDKYDPILEQVVYAFQDQRVVKLVEQIVGKENLIPDENLYAGGISYMGKGNFLNPHLDNSHDKGRTSWRAFNLLYYVSPNWKLEDGGNLELWPDGPKGKQIAIESKFNRLVVMITHNESWHSVSKVNDKAGRCCVSNYYFSEKPMKTTDSFHVTSFRGRPEQPIIDVVLQCDIALRQGIRKVFKKGIVENPHVYKK
ncbi:MAG: Rps23 Pro-64 3,4-dihydroxylase Tpa1-like proline 4-hydroxylase [Bermanella sp.]|jgi:Rps23 Pro-64 3,4-dihydroxylase Tpa1-like proline 4-hydroxylase